MPMTDRHWSFSARGRRATEEQAARKQFRRLVPHFPTIASVAGVLGNRKPRHIYQHAQKVSLPAHLWIRQIVFTDDNVANYYVAAMCFSYAGDSREAKAKRLTLEFTAR